MGETQWIGTDSDWDKLESWILGPYDSHIENMERILISMKNHKYSLQKMLNDIKSPNGKSTNLNPTIIDDDGEID